MSLHRVQLTVFFAWLASLAIVGAATVVTPSPSGSVMIITPAGPIFVNLTHAVPIDAGFRPPTIFSAPLPVGSGARALGQAGAFTAVADDATAASWNPAGLTQLESPEVSAVYRYSAREDSHESQTSDLEIGQNQYHSSELNYLSAVYPFLLNNRNAVVSVNYQESYDYTYAFSARFDGRNQESVNTTLNQIATQSITNTHTSPFLNVTSITDITTETESQIDKDLNLALLSGIDFRQSGTIDAISPAFAFDVNSRFSLGLTINIYTDGASRGNPIESTLVADYGGTSDSIADFTDTHTSTAIINWAGEKFIGATGRPVTNAIAGSAVTTPFITSETNKQTNAYTVEGVYREGNSTEDFLGVSATLGALWAATDKLSLGASIDLPWTGRGKQTKQINHQVSTFDSNLVQVASSSFVETQHRDVEYTFPLYWSVGGLWRWSDRFYTSLDASQTRWSSYSYKAEGDERINPINGEPHSSSALDDCWSARLGGEYLCMLSWTEIPLRGGLFWEQRPATGRPDEYWGFSLGSGISLGKGAQKAVLDIAYIFEQGKNVMGSLLPGEATHSDVNKHQLFVSAIWHF